MTEQQIKRPAHRPSGRFVPGPEKSDDFITKEFSVQGTPRVVPGGQQRVQKIRPRGAPFGAGQNMFPLGDDAGRGPAKGRAPTPAVPSGPKAESPARQIPLTVQVSVGDGRGPVEKIHSEKRAPHHTDGDAGRFPADVQGTARGSVVNHPFGLDPH
jgi:hypothetical protein